MKTLKICNLPDAVKRYVKDGYSIVFGGFTTNRKPYAAVYEIIRQDIKDLYIYGGPAGGDLDILIGDNRCAAYINSYTANSGYSNVSRCFRRFIEEERLIFEDYSLDVQVALFHAAALGLEYIPVKHMLDSDLVNRWGISREERLKHDKLPNEKLIIAKNPFNENETLCLLPTPKIDVAIIHAQYATRKGDVLIEGSYFIDIDIAMGAKYCIVTCEKIIGEAEAADMGISRCIPGFLVDAVIEVPFGAHPSQVYNFYDYDREFLQMYDTVSRTEKTFKNFLKEWVMDTRNQKQYVEKLTKKRLDKLIINS